MDKGMQIFLVNIYKKIQFIQIIIKYKNYYYIHQIYVLLFYKLNYIFIRIDNIEFIILNITFLIYKQIYSKFINNNDEINYF